MRYLILAVLFFGTIAFATLNDVDKAAIFPHNIIPNPGFENGKQNWSASGGGLTVVTSGSNLLTGKASVTWDSSAANQTLCTSAITIPNGLYAKNGVLACKFLTPSGTATHVLYSYDGSVTISPAITITSSTTPVYTFSNFIFPSSGTIKACISSTASNEPQITIDDCFMGDATEVNISNISQAQFIGSAYIAATLNCTGWTRTNAAYGAFAADTDCPGPTVDLNPGPGVIQTTDTDLPKFTVNNLPPGNYEVCMDPHIEVQTTATYDLTINDGTTSSGKAGTIGNTTIFDFPTRVCGNFTYTIAGNRTFELYGASTSGAIVIRNGTGVGGLGFSIRRFPLTSDQVYTTDQADFGWTAYTPTFGSGFGTVSLASFFYRRVGENLEVTGTANTGTVASATSSISLPGSLAIDTSKVPIQNTTSANGWGVGEFTALLTQQQSPIVTATGTSTTLVYLGFQLNQSTRLTPCASGASCGLSSASQFSLHFAVPISGWVVSSRAPQLVNSVIAGSNGVTRVGSVQVASGCTSATLNPDGMYASGVSNGTGDCTTTFATGYFSSTPICNCSAYAPNSTGLECYIINDTAASSTTIRTQTKNTSGTATAGSFFLNCKGAK